MPRRESLEKLAAALVWVAVVVLALVGPVIEPATPAQDEPTPRVAIVVSQKQYLSTQSARGSLEIDNQTALELGYNPISVLFLVREADGHVREQRLITTITHIIPTTLIPPGESRIFDIPLPACDVLIDPCAVHVALKLSFSAKPANISIVTRETSYSFVADPTATFRVDGLRLDRPLLIAQGQASAVVDRDRLFLQFRFAGSEPPDAEETVRRILARHGLTLEGVGNDDDLRNFEASWNGSGVPDVSACDVAIHEIQSQFGARAKLVSRSFQPQDDAFDQVFGVAHDASREAASRLADFLGTSPITSANGLSGDNSEIKFWPHDESGLSETPFISSQDFIFDASVQERKRSVAPESLDVLVRSADAYMGARMITEAPSSLGSLRAGSEYLGRGLSEITPLSARATIAADRPEVFTLAATTLQTGARLGLYPSAIAIVAARDQARALARALGVGTGDVSLVAQYPEFGVSADRTLAIYGVGVCITGESSAAWRRLGQTAPLPKPSPASPAAGPPTMIAFTPPPSPRPMPVPTGLIRARPDIVPIDVPEAQTTLTALGDVSIPATADDLRVDVGIDRGARTPDEGAMSGLPDSAAVERLLRAQPLVSDVAVQEERANALPVGYELVVRTWDTVRVRNLIAMIRSQYVRFRPVLKVGVSTVVGDCNALVTRAQEASVQRATQQAWDAASASGRHLRRLVLAAAYPLNTSDSCLPNALPDALDRAGDDHLRMPTERSVKLDVSVKLVFRVSLVHQ